MSALQAQWSVNRTTDNIIGVARGVVQAATTDDVQPLALLTAEAFGATLAVCPETRMKVEKEASRRHQTSVIRFLQAQIGYRANDAAAHLSQSDGGIRFLSIAAPLLSLANVFEGAKTIEALIRATASEGQLLPTLGQLQDLLEAVEYKLVRTGFANSVVGWEIYLTENRLISKTFRDRVRADGSHPNPSEIQAMVDALRITSRIGETNAMDERQASRVVITTAASYAWIIAFVRWCTGEPPFVLAVDDEAVLIDHPSPKVIVKCLLPPDKYTKPEFDVEILTDIDSPSETWRYREPNPQGYDKFSTVQWTGMLSISDFAKRRLWALELDTEEARSATIQALSYGVTAVAEHFHRKRRVAAKLKFQQYALPLLPSKKEIARALASFWDDEAVVQLPEKAMLRMTDQLPVVNRFISNLQSKCGCVRHCKGGSWSCTVSRYKEAINYLVAIVFALSMFDTAEPIHLFHRSDEEILRQLQQKFDLGKMLWTTRHEMPDIVIDEDFVSSLIGGCLSLVGHDQIAENNPVTWIASSGHGQVFYLSFLESLEFEENAHLMSIGGSPGDLHFENTKIHFVSAHSSVLFPDKSKLYEEPVISPENFIRDTKLKWQVEIRDRGRLRLQCGIKPFSALFNPRRLLSDAQDSVFVKRCPHPRDAPLSEPDRCAFYITPYYHPDHHPGGHVAVVAVDGDRGLRFHALGGQQGPAVIRGNACLECCIEICRSSELSTVVC